MSEETKPTPPPPVVVKPTLTPLEPTIRPAKSHVIIAVHGDGGDGKTMEIRHLVKAWGRDRVCVLSGEKGLETLGDLCPAHIELLSEQDVASLPPEKLLSKYVSNTLRAVLHLQQSFKKYDWWAFDGVSETADIILGRAQRLFDLKAPKYMTKQGNPDPRKLYADVGKIEAALFRDLHLIPCNGFLNTVTKETKEVETDQNNREVVKSITRKPLLAGAMIDPHFMRRWDAVLYYYSTRVQDLKNPKITYKKFLTETQGSKEGFDRIAAKLRVPASRPVPKVLCRGLLDPEGRMIYDPTKHWSIVRLWSQMTGQPMPQYDVTEPGEEWGNQAPEEREENGNDVQEHSEKA